ncbi:uncharacterized protein LOC116179415 [Photinus pyralis]|uniref:uncharacterized protein LOC116179415 n=1 Tax=Photinus pyralis TaxID=7054 RepID=UPI001266F7C5|nr:uncharacterized protein LOC116179415 [Photinus pyralis]
MAATGNYDWWIGGGKKERTSRGTAIVIRKYRGIEVEKFEEKSESISMAQIKTRIGRLTIIGCHIPSDKRRQAELRKLSEAIEQKCGKNPGIILGDFNAQLGKLDGSEDEEHGIGKAIKHEHDNGNGSELRNMP